MFIKISQNSQENRPSTLLKKRLRHRCLSVIFAKFFQNISGKLVLTKSSLLCCITWQPLKSARYTEGYALVGMDGIKNAFYPYISLYLSSYKMKIVSWGLCWESFKLMLFYQLLLINYLHLIKGKVVFMFWCFLI